MARSIKEIKDEIAAEFMRNEQAAERYGFRAGSVFSEYFSAASVENILFYTWAVGAWVLEQLVGRHRAEVEAELDRLMPHRAKWYRDKALAFMADMELMEDSDRYDTSGMSEDEIEKARVVRHAVATESADTSVLTIKVAGGEPGSRRPLIAVHERQLRAYLSEVKDAGVRVSLVNMEPDTFNCTVDIYYNAMLDPGGVKESCLSAINEYIRNLPFNGEYTNMALVDALQTVAGVRVVELLGSSARVAGELTARTINARLTPAAGYFKAGEITINMKAYDEQQ